MSGNIFWENEGRSETMKFPNYQSKFVYQKNRNNLLIPSSATFSRWPFMNNPSRMITALLTHLYTHFQSLPHISPQFTCLVHGIIHWFILYMARISSWEYGVQEEMAFSFAHSLLIHYAWGCWSRYSTNRWNNEQTKLTSLIFFFCIISTERVVRLCLGRQEGNNLSQ